LDTHRFVQLPCPSSLLEAACSAWSSLFDYPITRREVVLLTTFKCCYTKKIINEKYSELFKIIPARMVNQHRLVRFFGTTIETAEYQAKFFAWLCEEAGIDLPNLEKKFHRARFDKKKD